MIKRLRKLFHRKIDATAQEPSGIHPLGITGPPQYEIRSIGFYDTDFEKGPPDPSFFYDCLVVHIGQVGVEGVWTYEAMIGTPAGVLGVMNENDLDYAFLDKTILIARYDKDLIVRMVQENIRSLPNLMDDVS